MAITRIGAWVDRRGVGSDWRRWLNVAVAVGLTDVSLCVHGQDAGKPFEPFQTAEKVANILKAYRMAGIRGHVMLWPQPRMNHAVALLDYLGRVADLAGHALTSAELDAEEQWTRSGYRVVFGRSVAEQLRAGWPSGLPLVVNGITAALPKIKPLIAIADVVIPQAYTSTRKGQGSTPGVRQRVVLDTWAKAAPKARLVCGLAAYDQEGAGDMSANDALSAAFNAAAERVDEARYWQLAELAGGPDAAFVKARCAELPR
ncbi:MAG: hypothetical protein IV100_15135 [Myxococcales bacterium]|nr:hypothetical protein [Myxococcales bacterium]